MTKQLPEPLSKIGEVETETLELTTITIAQISSDDFNQYVRLCQEKGFNIDVLKNGTSFSAKNDLNYKLNITIKNSFMKIQIQAPCFDTTLSIKVYENWFFSIYDVEIYLDERYLGTVEQGNEEEFEETLSKGKHTLEVYSSNDNEIKGKYKFNITKDESLNFEIFCHSDEITIDDETTYEEEKSNITKVVTTTKSNTNSTTKKETLVYSSNDYETAKKGKSGVFAYIRTGGEYDTYWIIDLNKGYAYFFLDGDGNNTYNKVKIKSGNLNDKVTITWDYDGEKTDWYMHFKYKENPSTLVIVDHLNLTTEYRTTSLSKALEKLDEKEYSKY